MEQFTEEKLTLKGQEISVKIGSVSQFELKFYLENPRLYSLVRSEGQDPTQEDIQDILSKKDHVKHLVKSIQENGGLIDPVIVLSGKNIVLEGNSRLAAYRILSEKDPIKWGKIKAKFLPEDIAESSIFALLGEYHIIGKTDWAPYEQAGYLYRRHKNHHIDIPTLASEIGLSTRAVGHLVYVYQFMLDNNETDVNRWSYYDEYLKSNKIKKARDEYPELDHVVVEKIRSGDIPKAIDIREGLQKICDAGGKTLHKFANKQLDFDDSLQAAEHRGAGDHAFQRLKKFRDWIVDTETEDSILELNGDAQKRCLFELEKIKKKCESLTNKLSHKN